MRNEVEDPKPADEERATIILTVAVISILIMAPIGALTILFSGPHLLNYTPTEEEMEDKIKNKSESV